MICLTRLSNSIDGLLHNGGGRRGVEPGLLLQADNGGEGKMFKMIVSLLGLCVGDLWSESHHNKETKWSSGFWTTKTALCWSPGRICCA